MNPRSRPSWRQAKPSIIAVRYAFIGVMLVTASGASCNRSIRNPFATYAGPPAPEVLAAGASRDQIIAAVNQNSARIVSYQSTNATITVPGSPGVPSLSGRIAVERPGRIRLEASTALTGKEVDLGSNDELFWVWVRRSEPPALYFSRHDRYAGSQAQQFLPVEPAWLLDALGLAEFRPGDFHEGPVPHGKDTVEIKSVVQSASGQMVKRTVVDARRALVLEQHVYDQRGALLASAVAKSHRYHPEIGASLPQQIEVQIPPAGLALSIDVGTVAINAPLENPQVWSMPTITGAQPVDLGAAPPASPGGGPPTIGDSIHSADWNGPAPSGETPTQLAGPHASPSFATPMAIQASAAPPQFIPPGGTPQPLDPFTNPPLTTDPAPQRLPTGGIAAQPALTR